MSGRAPRRKGDRLEEMDTLILKGDRTNPLIVMRLVDVLEPLGDRNLRKPQISTETGGDMPGDTKPYLARQEKKRSRRPKPGTIRQLSAVLWRAITHLETHLDTTASSNEVDTAELCKLTHALSQSASTYLKAVEVGELEARLEALEKAQTAVRDTPQRWAA